ncbi:MAG TPA: zinc ribbon domain-containing protein [Chitinophagales bacterium]|nr:zinc ribbon domain-containing protein [Chitinophagales bacterium]
MYCTNCRSEIQQGSSFCQGCGAQVKSAFATVSVRDEPIGWGWGIACTLFPPLGLIMFFVWMGSKPRKSKHAIICALVAIFAHFVNLSNKIAEEKARIEYHER